MVKRIDKLRCKKCRHTWVARRDDVVACPRCKSYYWNSDKNPKQKELNK